MEIFVGGTALWVLNNVGYIDFPADHFLGYYFLVLYFVFVNLFIFSALAFEKWNYSGNPILMSFLLGIIFLGHTYGFFVLASDTLNFPDVFHVLAGLGFLTSILANWLLR